MAISTVKISSQELRDIRKNLVRQAVVALAMSDATPEEGMDELVSNDKIATALTAWRTYVRKNDGGVDAIADALFTPQEREKLRESADILFKRRGTGAPQMGDHAAVKVCERLLLTMAFQTRNAKNPHLQGEYAAARLTETLRDGIPPLVAPKMAATADTIGWFEKLIAELGG